jgi:hypothetical protein
MSTNANLKNFSAEEVEEHISGKFELYDSAIRNVYYLPKYKSGIITENYLTNVILGEIFCPKFSDIKLLPCPSPPDKETLIRWVNNLKSPTGKSFGIGYEDHTPNKDWLVVILSTYRADLKIFKKDYVAPPRVVKAEDKPNIALPSDFLDNLPPTRKKTKAKRLTMISKGKKEGQIERAKFLAERYAQDKVQYEEELRDIKKKQKVKVYSTSGTSGVNASTVSSGDGGQIS